MADNKDVLVIGAGGVASVTLHKMAMNPDLFSGPHLRGQSARWPNARRLRQR